MTDDQIQRVEVIAATGSLLQMGGTSVQCALTAEDFAALRALLALTERRCGNCGHARKQDDRAWHGEVVLVCANESEAHPLPWCGEVSDNFGCHNWVAKP